MARKPTAKRSLALSRVDGLIGRAFSIVALISGIEMLFNAVPQAAVLNPYVMYTSIGLILAVQVFNIWNFWFWRATASGYLVHAFLVLAIMLLWPLQLLGRALPPEGFRPWLWWATGIASMAIGWHIERWWAWAYICLMPLVWIWVHYQPWGGSGELSTVLQDASYILLFPATIVGLAHLLRSAANRVDEASELATQAAIERARIDAKERERSRIDALVHDSVLTTLLVAANANTPDQAHAAVDSAKNAVARLREAARDEAATDSVSVISFFQALGELVQRQDPRAEISVSGADGRQLEAELVAALTDATSQAVANSLQHAGRSAKRLVRMKATAKEIKIVIKDDGVGFWPSRVPKNRLGLRMSIIDRVEAVDGRVFIDSKPGHGASIVLEWQFDD